jgi:hypothetical protein
MLQPVERERVEGGRRRLIGAPEREREDQQGGRGEMKRTTAERERPLQSLVVDW